MQIKDADRIANTADPDLSLLCLPRTICLKTEENEGTGLPLYNAVLGVHKTRPLYK